MDGRLLGFFDCLERPPDIVIGLFQFMPRRFMFHVEHLPLLTYFCIYGSMSLWRKYPSKKEVRHACAR